jgi:molecular chaperone IbpA
MLLKEDVAMTNYDFSPLYRSSVGFDRLFDMLDQASRVQPTNWPPYNIERLSEDEYRITMAVAGFSPDEIELVQKENALFVMGQKDHQPDGVEVLHRGIATRSFKQTFNLADHVKVTGASLENGLLVVELKREIPEALKPRRIEIASTGGPKAVSHDYQPEQIDQPANAA